MYTILASFCSFSIWEGADIRPEIKLRKIPLSPVSNSIKVNPVVYLVQAIVPTVCAICLMAFIVGVSCSTSWVNI